MLILVKNIFFLTSVLTGLDFVNKSKQNSKKQTNKNCRTTRPDPLSILWDINTNLEIIVIHLLYAFDYIRYKKNKEKYILSIFKRKHVGHKEIRNCSKLNLKITLRDPKE